MTESVAARVDHIPSVRECRPDVSRSIDAVITRCLQPNPAFRYRTARELADDLHCELENLPLRHAPNPSWQELFFKWRHRNPRRLSLTSLAVVTFASIVISVFGFVLLMNRLDRLQAETQWEQIRELLPEIRSMLSAPDAGRDELALGLQKAESMMSRLQIASSVDDIEESRMFAGNLALLSPGNASAMELAVQDTAFLVAAGKLHEARTQGDVVKKQQLLSDAAHWNSVATGLQRSGRLNLELRLQNLSIHSAHGHDVSAELQSIRKELLEPGFMTEVSFASAIQTLDDGRPQEAEVLLEQLVMKYLLGKSRQVQSSWTGGEAAFSTCIALNSDCWLAWRDRGICRLQQQHLSEAEADLREVLSLRPEDATAYLNLGLALFRRGQLQEAEKCMSDSIALGGPTRAWFIRSQLKAIRHDPSGADLDFRKGVQTEPNEVDSWIARGMAVLETDAAAALEDFETALLWYPMSRDALQNMAHVLSEHLDRPQEAIRQLDRLLSMYPDDSLARAGRSVLLARLEKSGEAIDDAERVLAQSPGAIEVYQAACVFSLISRSGNDRDSKSRALELLRQSFRQRPELSGLASDDPDLDQLRDLPEFQSLLLSARNLADEGSIVPISDSQKTTQTMIHRSQSAASVVSQEE